MSCVVLTSAEATSKLLAEADDLNTMAALHDKLRDIFRASPPQPEKSPYLSRYDLKKSVFVAHRFDDTGKTVAGLLMTFLRRLGFDGEVCRHPVPRQCRIQQGDSRFRL